MSAARNDGGPVYPSPGMCAANFSATNRGQIGRTFESVFPDEAERRAALARGISVRDYLAAHESRRLGVSERDFYIAQALTGETSPLPLYSPAGELTADMILQQVLWWARADAIHRYIQADAMLAARGA